jgi:hypothetical protein
METAIDCPAAHFYSTVAFNVRCETTNRDALVSDDEVQNKLNVAEFDPAQG